MSEDNIKSHKKPRFQPLFRRYIFRKTTGGVKLTHAAVLELKLFSQKTLPRVTARILHIIEKKLTMEKQC